MIHKSIRIYIYMYHTCAIRERMISIFQMFLLQNTCFRKPILHDGNMCSEILGRMCTCQNLCSEAVSCHEKLVLLHISCTLYLLSGVLKDRGLDPKFPIPRWHIWQTEQYVWIDLEECSTFTVVISNLTSNVNKEGQDGTKERQY